jgi:hypothetical protein
MGNLIAERSRGTESRPWRTRAYPQKIVKGEIMYFFNRQELKCALHLVLLLAVWWGMRLLEQPPQQPAPEEARREAPPDKDPTRAELHLLGVRVLPTKANGRSWDVRGGLPDPYVTITTWPGGGTYKSPVQKDTLHAVYNTPTGLRVTVGTFLQIWVKDQDTWSRDDLIGYQTIEVTEEMLRQGSIDRSFGQVASLQLVLQPLP